MYQSGYSSSFVEAAMQKKSRLSGCLKIVGIGFAAVVVLFIALIGFWTIRTNQESILSEKYLDHREGAPGQFITTADGYTLHYETHGDPQADAAGAPILMLHGFNQTSNTEFSLVAPYMSPTRSLIMPDLLGFGYSQRVTQPAPALSIRGQAHNMAQMLDAMGVQQVDVVGVSYAGAVAAQFALDYPDRVRKLVLIGPQLFDLGGGIFAQLGQLPFGVGRALTWDALGAGPRGTQLQALGCQTGDYCPTPERAAERQRRAEIRGTTDTFIAINSTPANTDVPASLSQIKASTLLLYGDRDAYYPREVAERAKAAMPAAQLQFVPSADHTPHMHRPEDTARILSAFLD
jgi:pimeloyl-ACP methyl ester carboxylesterase